jgi:hypothetical protein
VKSKTSTSCEERAVETCGDQSSRIPTNSRSSVRRPRHGCGGGPWLTAIRPAYRANQNWSDINRFTGTSRRSGRRFSWI